MVKLYKIAIIITIGIVSFSSCKHIDESFLIEKSRVGPLNAETQVNDIIEIFENDSIRIIRPQYNEKFQSKYLQKKTTFQVFSADGEHLLNITPLENDILESKIEHVEILSNKYKTLEGLTIDSKFGDFKSKYHLKYTPTLRTVMVEIPELNAAFSIRMDTKTGNLLDSKINPDEIPEDSDVMNFTVWMK